MAKKMPPQNGDGIGLRGPQLAPPADPAPAGTCCTPADMAVGKSVMVSETVAEQIKAMAGVVLALKAAIADATLQIAAVEQQRADLITQIRAADERHMSVVRAAAASLGIDPASKDRGWSWNPPATFTRTR